MKKSREGLHILHPTISIAIPLLGNGSKSSLLLEHGIGFVAAAEDVSDEIEDLFFLQHR